MNLKSLCLYCDLPIEKARSICPGEVALYIELLYRVARTGGHSTEEEIFVENLASLLELDPSLLREAVQQSRSPAGGIRASANRLRNSELRHSAYLHACHLTRLDQEISPAEVEALSQAQEGLGLSGETALQARQLAERHDALLHTFCQLASAPDPADLWASYLQEGIRHADRRRKKILPDPLEKTKADERVATLALSLKLSGVGWRSSAESMLIENLSAYLRISEAQKGAALQSAWSMDASLRSLVDQIRHPDLRLVALSDAHGVCKSDSWLDAAELSLLSEIIECFDIPGHIAGELIALAQDEAAYRRTVEATPSAQTRRPQ